MNVLAFGKTGQLARELCRYDGVTAVGRDVADLCDPTACVDIIHATNPDVIINAAAYTAVDRAETEPDLALQINATTPIEMAAAAAQIGVPFLHVSTDYVFDGSGVTPWNETDKTNPVGVYGRTKLQGEAGIFRAHENAAILRTSWVFSAHGNNFVKTMLKLSETRSELNIVNDQIGGPTPARDIAGALMTMAGAMVGGQKGGLYHFAGAPCVSWETFAKEIFAQSGRAVDVTGIPSIDYPTPAERPKNSRLDCRKILADFGIQTPDWRMGLADVITELKADKS